MSKNGVLFDLDVTLVTSFKTDPLPGIRTILDELKAQGVPVGVATNQAGPLWRAVTEQEKYPSIMRIAANLSTIAQKLRLENDLWIVSLWDDRAMKLVESTEGADAVILHDLVASIPYDLLHMLNPHIPNLIASFNPAYRKPNPGMLLKACQLWKIKPGDLIYVGDMESDREAAQRAGAQFVDASVMGKLRDLI